jgi:hypothetical protein
MNYADLKAMMAEVGVTVEILSAEELAAELSNPTHNDKDRRAS